jgi:hypothetical protein
MKIIDSTSRSGELAQQNDLAVTRQLVECCPYMFSVTKRFCEDGVTQHKLIILRRAGHRRPYKAYVRCRMTGPVTVPVTPGGAHDRIRHTDGR